jgi:hypothetical protein
MEVPGDQTKKTPNTVLKEDTEITESNKNFSNTLNFDEAVSLAHQIANNFQSRRIEDKKKDRVVKKQDISAKKNR